MGHSTECKLGYYEFRYSTVDPNSGETTYYARSTFEVDAGVKALMNRAARDTEGVIGVIQIEDDPEKTFAVLLDPGVDVAATIQAYSTSLNQRLKEEQVPRFTSLSEPAPSAHPDALHNALAVYSPTRGRATD